MCFYHVDFTAGVVHPVTFGCRANLPQLAREPDSSACRHRRLRQSWAHTADAFCARAQSVTCPGTQDKEVFSS